MCVFLFSAFIILFMLFQVDIREDEDQGVKLSEIVELLVASGYFRARIKGLSPFDKVRIQLHNCRCTFSVSHEWRNCFAWHTENNNVAHF